MKYLLLCLAFAICIPSIAQTTYRLRFGQILQEYDIATSTKGANRIIRDSYYFEIETMVGTDYIIRLLEFDADLDYDGADGATLNTQYFGTAANPIYFFLPGPTFTTYAIPEEIPEFSGTTFGLVNIPMKFRFANRNPEHRKRYTDLEGNVNLGISVAQFLRVAENQTFYIAGGVSITQIRADEINTLNFVSKTENRSGFSVFAGVIYQKDTYQVGILIGTDYVSGQIADYWVYQGKPWIGLGIGLGIFQPNAKQDNNQPK
jgi:hypothetical protein